MKKVIDNRTGERTCTLIKLSAEKKIPIVTRNQSSVISILHEAKRLGAEIPQPISIADIMSDMAFHNVPGLDGLTNVIIDDIEYVMQEILRMRGIDNIEAFSICTSNSNDEIILCTQSI